MAELREILVIDKNFQATHPKTLRPLQFKTVIVLWICGILYFSLLLATGFFLKTYSNEKLSSVLETEVGSTGQFAGHLDNIILTAPSLTSEEVKDSPEVILTLDNVCGPSGALTISNAYSHAIADSKFPTQGLSQFPEVRDACLKIATDKDVQSLLFGSSEKFIVPYLIVLLRTLPPMQQKLLMISMDGLGRSASGVQEILSRSGESVWSSSGLDDLKAFPVDSARLKEVTEKALISSLPGLVQEDNGTIASYAPISSQWVLFSFGSKAQVLESVQAMELQFVWLLLGASFLVLFASRQLVERLSTPLQNLSLAAEQVSHGEFNTRLEITGDREFQLVQGAFNHMTGELTRLIEVAKSSTRMEAELELARSVQQVLFPPKKLSLGPHEIRSQIRTASQCGGDWWGCIPVQDKLVLMIGDVLGHGTAPALVTAATHGSSSMLTEWITQDPSLITHPERMLEFFNRTVHDGSAGMLTMSFLMCVLDPSKNEITIANAGHNWPYLISLENPGAGTPTYKLTSMTGEPSPLLGANRSQKFTTVETHPWNVGSKIVLYTDGLIECFKDDKNLFDRKLFIRTLREAMPGSAEKILEKVLQVHDTQTKGLVQEDDLTLVISSRGERK